MQNPFLKKNSSTPWIVATFLLVGILVGLGIQTMFSKNDEKIIGGGDNGLIENVSKNTTENIEKKNIEPQKTAEEIFQEIAEEIGLKKDDFSACLANGLTAEEVKKDAEDGRSYGVTSTPTFFINGRMVVGALPYDTFATIFEEELAKKAPSENRITVSADDDLALGDFNAPITMIEFSDLQCPFCARFHADAFPQIQENYINTGKVRYVIRDFPLAFHANASKAAQAAECAKMQGAFSSKLGERERIYFEYVGKLFERNSEWTQ